MINIQPILKLAVHKKNRCAIVIAGAIIGVLATSAAIADDISVYGLEPKAPQILLTLDYSGSMTANAGGQQRIEVLRETVLSLLDTYQDRVKFGIGPMFGANGGGVQWPISDLRLDANETDDNIDEGKKTGLEIVTDIINNTGLLWGTATVPALAESLQYFRGGTVSYGGVYDANVVGFKPLEWDNNLDNGLLLEPGGFIEYNSISGNSAAYTPRNAYSVGTAPGSKGYCSKRLPAKGAQRVVSDCNFLPSTYTVSNCEAWPAAGYTRDGIDFGINNDHAEYPAQVCEYEHSDQWATAKYISPINNECQANSIIMVTDGEPVNAVNNKVVKDILGVEYSSCADTESTLQRTGGNCAEELAAFATNTNLISGNASSKVTTHTIGFGTSFRTTNYLTNIAIAGNGEYHSAANAADLYEALDELITGELPEAQQFNNFSVDVNRAAFSHDNRAYVPLFNPSDSLSWIGNVKGYFIGEDGLEDVDGNPALDATTDITKFADTARSFWSSSADGNSAELGGAASKIDPTARNLYTYLGTTVNAPIDLSTSENYELSVNNTAMRRSYFGWWRRINLSELLDWIPNQPMGEPLHSNIAIANYDGDTRVIYTMTNQGFLHAIDASLPVNTGDYSGGEEIFAFMPRALLPNIQFMKNGGYTGEHLYGLDGAITPWHTDHNGDGVVNDADTLILVFGMRRGGKHYYAMDVTDPQNPVLVWQITGNSSSAHPDFVSLAQTWSEPQLITVQNGATEERVMVFGGGYDDSVDDIHAPTQSSGNSIFMIDSDGDLIWSASHPDMNYAIPSDLRVIDSDGDNVADRIYAGDLGGQVWRVDFDDVSDTSEFEVTKFADLSSYGYQPFFYPPSVSRDSNSNDLFVAIGSGNRDNPVEDITEGAIYMMKDNHADTGAPDTSTFNTIVNSDLTNITEQTHASSEDLASSMGWVIDLEEGEKSLSSVVTINGDLLATTYLPTIDSTYNGCGVPDSDKRLYVVNVSDGGAPNNTTAAEFNTTPVARYIDIDVGGIPTEPYALFVEGSDTIDVYTGYEKQLELTQTMSTVFWYEK